jgi:hypothetical protein
VLAKIAMTVLVALTYGWIAYARRRRGYPYPGPAWVNRMSVPARFAFGAVMALTVIVVALSLMGRNAGE